MHGSVLGFFAYGALQTGEVAGRQVLEVGALDVNGSVRFLVESRQPAGYLGVDIVAGGGVDVLASADQLVHEFGRNAFDVVISTEMLEHADDWQAAILGMVDVVRPGGVLVITTRSPGFAYHHPPDRWRYTQATFAEIAARLGLDLVVLMDDPEYPGVFVKMRKPAGWVRRRTDLAGVPGVTPMRAPRRLLGLPMQPDGTGYYRFWQPWTQLARAGEDLAIVPPVTDYQWRPSEDDAAEFDLISAQRVGGRLGLRDWHRWAALSGPRLVYETDDDVLHPDPTLPHLLDEDRQASIRECLQVADAVTCSTEPLAESLREHNPSVYVVPNYVHEDLLAITRPRRERPTLVWAGGITHLPDMVLIQDVMGDLASEAATLGRGGFDLHLIGVDYSPLFECPTRFTPWQVDVWDYYRAIDGDVGIIPLAGTRFNASRSSVKALEYAALGIPVVASDVPAYRGFVVDGVTGFLARTPEDWTRHLRDLLADEAMRAEMGAKARELAESWTIQRNWRRWADVFERIIGGDHG